MTDLPQCWAAAPLAVVAQVQLGRQRSPKNHSGPHMRPYLRAANVTWQGLALDDVKQMNFSPDEADTFRLRPGDILLSEASGSASEVGKPALWNGEIDECCFQNTLLRVRTAHLEPRYLLWFFKWLALSGQFARASRGVGIHHLGAKALSEWNIPVAPSDEQKRIVAAIEEQFSRLDAGVAALERARRNLGRMRDAIRFAATLGQLVPQDPCEEPAASLIARVKPAGRFRGIGPLPSDLVALPPGWSWALMGALAQRVTVGHVGPMKDEYVSEGIPFLRSQNVREDRFDPDGLRFISPPFHERLTKSRLTPGDLVVVRSGNVGTACVVPDSLGEANCADLVIVQRPEAIDPYYAALYMNSLARSRIRAGRVGVALTHFNTQSVAELPVPVPPMEEQKRIVAEAQGLMSVVDSLETDLLGALGRASSLRSSILRAAFSGRLAPQDPTEESALALLQQIAAGRASSTGRSSAPVPKPRAPREEVPA